VSGKARKRLDLSRNAGPIHHRRGHCLKAYLNFALELLRRTRPLHLGGADTIEARLLQSGTWAAAEGEAAHVGPYVWESIGCPGDHAVEAI